MREIKFIMKRGKILFLFFISAISVHAQITANFLVNEVCLGDTNVFLDASLPQPDSWYWDFGDGSPAEISQNPDHVYLTSGIYYATLIVTFGIYIDTISKPVTVFSLPVADAGVDTFYCLGDSIQLFAFGAGGGGNYLWSPDYFINCTTCNDPFVKPVKDTTYTLIVTDINGCKSTDSVFVDRKKIPVVLFTYSVFWKFADFHNLTTEGENYIWQFGDGDTSSTFEPLHEWDDFGVYHVTLYAFSDCGYGEFSENITLVNPADNIEEVKSSFTISPNPSDGIFKIISKSSAKLQSVSVYNSLGQMICENQTDVPGEIIVDISAMPKGFYHLIMRFEDKFAAQKIILK